jgi:hypothetical protein
MTRRGSVAHSLHACTLRVHRIIVHCLTACPREQHREHQASLFDLGKAVSNAQNTQNKVLGEPKTRVATAGSWVDCADLASLCGRPIPSSEARASIRMAPKRMIPKCNTREQDYGLKILGGTRPPRRWSQLRAALYTEGKRGDRKRRATANVKYFPAPFRVDHGKSHMRVAHPELSP